ncbi:MAG: 3-hydroxyacyl-CoA dehydrogenase NAD-binding domain-containing protein, partial [Burkholderiales bacterium]
MAIKIIGVIGAGTMGSGIAQAFSAKGFSVILQDVSNAALEKGVATISNSLDRLIKKGVATADE